MFSALILNVKFKQCYSLKKQKKSNNSIYLTTLQLTKLNQDTLY